MVLETTSNSSCIGRSSCSQHWQGPLRSISFHQDVCESAHRIEELCQFPNLNATSHHLLATQLVRHPVGLHFVFHLDFQAIYHRHKDALEKEVLVFHYVGEKMCFERGGRKKFDAASALTKNTFKYVEHSAEKVSKSFMESKVQTCLSFPAASDAYREVRL